uniref:Uncharacterized protein n=1 Tax=Amphimedon queenslandica TaxID=400682 RepID=A0A1X7TW46_AMPQE
CFLGASSSCMLVALQDASSALCQTTYSILFYASCKIITKLNSSLDMSPCSRSSESIIFLAILSCVVPVVKFMII